MTTLDLAAAAAFLGVQRETLRERAAAGIIPGAKIGKEWRFLQDDLTAYFRSQCRSSVAPAAPTGGSTSATLAATPGRAAHFRSHYRRMSTRTSRPTSPRIMMPRSSPPRTGTG